MNELTFYLEMATIQAENDRPVRAGELALRLNFSRSYIHNHLNRLLRQNLVRRVARGQYVIESTTAARNVGFCVLLPMDVYERQSIRSLR
jgi:DNA-binding IclR family transcriptional regulator